MKKLILISICIQIVCNSCNEFLDVKPDKQLATPSTLADIEAILNRVDQLNMGVVPDVLEFSGDNYFLPYDDYQAISVVEFRQMYLWESEPVYSSNWVGGYTAIFYANTALDELKKIKPSDNEEKSKINELEGRAHFFRGYYFLKLVQAFASSYSKENFDEPGIVLRLNSNVNELSKRSTVKASYDQAIEDLSISLNLLPNTSQHRTQPNKAAAFGALAQAHLSMQNYSKAGEYAQSCLEIYTDILDFNTLPVDSQYPFTRYNTDVVFYCTMGSSPIPPRLKINKDLLKLYSDDDLRRKMYFAQLSEDEYNFKGNYAQNNSGFFGGITVGDMILIVAETDARDSDFLGAKRSLERLLVKRYKTGTAPLLAEIDNTEVLEFILNERRKEMAFKGYRWQDLRRLSRDAIFSKELIREFNGKIAARLSSDQLFDYAHLIPLSVMEKVEFEQNNN
ncbi:MAG: RagB/SusD family nutrient uptake outer membrane protein [Sphingobacterium sp.]